MARWASGSRRTDDAVGRTPTRSPHVAWPFITLSPSRSTFPLVWARALAAVGVSGHLHLHDLRHAGNHLAALSGATTRELKGRMGPASMRAALEHRTRDRDRDRDRRTADSMDLLLGDRGIGGRSEIGHVEGTDAR